jgi:uncharacterized protein YgiM (DUF1202 family)
MTTPTPAQPTANSPLRRWRWALVAIAIVALAFISGRGGAQLETNDPDGGERDTGRCTVTVAADVLNVRAGPGTQHATVDRLSRGTVVDAQQETSEGFRKLAEGRWVASEFVRPSSGCD